MNTISVIPTLFDGILFRSRLEARWACFYKTLGIKYSYEHEGYKGNNGIMYLPDFYIQHLDCFIEIKGQYPNNKEFEKARFLSDGLNKNVYIFHGFFPKSTEISNYAIEYGANDTSAIIISPFQGDDYHYLWCECPVCEYLGIEFDARSDRLKCGCNKCGRDKGYNGDSQRLINAYFKASNKKFEK